MRVATTTSGEREHRLVQVFRLMRVDDELRDLHGRVDEIAGRRRDALLDQRLEVVRQEWASRSSN